MDPTSPEFERNHRAATPASAPTLPTGPGPGGAEGSLVGATLVGRYRVDRAIASGGMGSVYEAYDRSLDRVVALKTVLPGRRLEPEAVARFRREATAAAQLDHPNIVPVHDFGDQDGLQFFTMALVDGPSLQRAIDRDGPMPPAEAVRLMIPIVEAVEYAHRRRFLHRDLKPDNVLIDAQGRPRVTDFGLARHLLQPGSITGAGQLLGTPSYMAPEQARNCHEAIGPATDVYALGGILGFLLGGRPPVPGDSITDVLLNVVDGRPTLPGDVAPGIPKSLNEICRRCLAKAPADRFPTAEALAVALRAFAAGEPRAEGTRPKSATRTYAAMAGVAAVILVGWMIFGRPRPQPPAPKSRAEAGPPPSAAVPAKEAVAAPEPPTNSVVATAAPAPASPTPAPSTAPDGPRSPVEAKPAPATTPAAMSPRIAALAKRLKDESADIRATAAESLQRLGSEATSAVPALVDRIRDDVWSAGALSRDNSSSNTSKDAAVAALRTLAPDEVEPAVRAATLSKDWHVREWASQALGSPAAKDGGDGDGAGRVISPRVAALAARLKDDVAEVRHAAAVALGGLGKEAIPAVPALIDRVKDDVWSPSALSPDNSSTNTSKDAALNALRKLARDKVEGALVAASESKNKTVAEWATARLADPNP